MAYGKAIELFLVNGTAHTTFGMVYSYMKKTNIPSSAIAHANGMTLLSEFTDDEGDQTVVYGISRAEWADQISEHGFRLQYI